MKFAPLPEDQAEDNLIAYLEDLGLDDVEYELLGSSDNVWFDFSLMHGKRSIHVSLPAVALESIRYTAGVGQKIYNYPLIETNGTPLIWIYAVGLARELLKE